MIHADNLLERERRDIRDAQGGNEAGGLGMVRPEDGGGGDDYIDVDVNSLADAGVLLRRMATKLQEEIDRVIPPAIDALDAFPPSDLYNAYAFCWGRWSAVLDSAHTAVSSAGDVAVNAATGYRRTDEHGRHE